MRLKDSTLVVGRGAGGGNRQAHDHQGRRQRSVGAAPAKAHEQGTVKDVNGNNATLIQVNGLQTPLCLSSVREQPKNGDLVAVTGIVTDGKTIKVGQLRQLPK